MNSALLFACAGCACAVIFFRAAGLRVYEFYFALAASILVSVFAFLNMPAPAALCTALFCGAAFIYYSLPRGNDAGFVKHASAAAAVVLLAFLLSGCGNGPVIMPVIKEEIRLGFVPSALAVSSKDELYIGNERAAHVVVYNYREKKEIKKIRCGNAPSDIVISGDMVYITGRLDNTLTVYNSLTGESSVINVQGRSPSAVAVSGDRLKAYTANSGGSSVSVIDLEAGKAAGTIETGRWPSDVLLSPDGRKLYVACKYTNTIQVIDAERQRNLFTKIETGVSPVKLLQLNKRIVAVIHEWEYSFNNKSSMILFDTENYTVVSSIVTDGGIFDGALSKSKKYIYLSVPLKDRVIFIDAAGKDKKAEIFIKNSTPKALALSKNGQLLFAASQGSKRITVIKVNDLI